MEKYLLTFELRYTSLNTYKDDLKYNFNTITLGVFDDYKEACKQGNLLLDKLDSKYEKHPCGRRSLSENCYLVGRYHKVPFDYFLKIESLKFKCYENEIDKAIEGIKEYRNWRDENDN